MLIGCDNFPLWLFYNNIRFFFHVSKLSATESSSVMFGSDGGSLGPSGVAVTGVGGFPKLSIQSVSLGQLFGESAVVGSQRALSGQSRHGQSTIVSIDAGSLLG
jgi:hypothetical protein